MARIDVDPYENDPARWGHSLANLAEIVLGCLDARGAKSVAEVGAYAGDLTRVLLDWAEEAGARVLAVDPTPHARLVELSESRADLELVQEPSYEALRHIPLPDAVIIDGDHNYYTVSEELRLIDERAPGPEIPLLLLHDVGWPHGRRDAYWNPERIPEDARQPILERPFIFPGEPGVVDAGMPMYAAAEREGGAGNGVLTALEDFLDRRRDLRLAMLPPFFGFAVAWHHDAAWAPSVAGFVEPWDRHPVFARLEANRLYHLAIGHARAQKLRWATAQLEAEQEKNRELREQLEERDAELERLRSKSSA
jgi:hypothetical protein